MTEVDDIALTEVPYGSDLYGKTLELREAILRKPLGLRLSQEELADDALRRHFCALTNGTVVGSVSFKPLGPHTLQLKQMAVAQGSQREGVGSRLLAFAEAWAQMLCCSRPLTRSWFQWRWTSRVREAAYSCLRKTTRLCRFSFLPPPLASKRKRYSAATVPPSTCRNKPQTWFSGTTRYLVN